MATRSTIALEYADGSVDVIYCHWDGYISNNGKILQEAYTDPFKVQQLMDLGAVSSLGRNIGEKHNFDSPSLFTPEYEQERARSWCKFYGRDRGEADIEATRYKDYDEYLRNEKSWTQDYNYILRKDGIWYVSSYHFKNVPLTEAIVKSESEE